MVKTQSLFGGKFIADLTQTHLNMVNVCSLAEDCLWASKILKMLYLLIPLLVHER